MLALTVVQGLAVFRTRIASRGRLGKCTNNVFTYSDPAVLPCVTGRTR